jgi:hypothetical protein
MAGRPIAILLFAAAVARCLAGARRRAVENKNRLQWAKVHWSRFDPQGAL